jgi:hypothetical protein
MMDNTWQERLVTTHSQLFIRSFRGQPFSPDRRRERGAGAIELRRILLVDWYLFRAQQVDMRGMTAMATSLPEL